MSAKRRRRRPRVPPEVWILALGLTAVGFLVGLWLGRGTLRDGNGPAARQVAPPPSRAPAHPGTRRRESPRSPTVRTPAAERSAPRARIALVIDDLGRSLADVRTLVELGVPLSYAVLPFESMTRQVDAELLRHREEVLCHLPMEPNGGANPGPGALTSGMSGEELERATRAALDAVPGAVGVNNHMGSELSSDPRAMRVVLGVLADRGLFFLDSRTSAASVGYPLAREMGLPAAERQVFLDGTIEPQAIREQFDRLLAVARQRGAAVAIAHPHPATLAILAEEIPRAQAAGYEFVPVSYLLDRSEEFPE